MIALLDMDIRSPEPGPEAAASDPRVQRVDCYALAEVDRSGYRGLIISGMVDQEHLLRHRDRIAGYLADGGVVVFGGHLHRRWLPGGSPFVPLAGRGLADYRVAEVAEHPVFTGLGPDELTFRRGVAGFFARGHHPPPPGAEVLTRLAGGQPTTYLDRHSTAGTILVQATSDPLSSCGRRLLDWIDDEHTARGARPRPPGPKRPSGLAAVYGDSSWHHRALTHPRYARYLTGGLLYLQRPAQPVQLGHHELIAGPVRRRQGLVQLWAGTRVSGGLVDEHLVTAGGGECIMLGLGVLVAGGHPPVADPHGPDRIGKP